MAKQISMQLVTSAAGAPVVQAPPVLDARGAEEFACGQCGTVLLKANEGQIHHVIVQCAICNAFNATSVQQVPTG